MSGAREELAELFEDVAPELRRVIDSIKEPGIAEHAAAETLESLFADWTSSLIRSPNDDMEGQKRALMAEYDRLLDLLLALRPKAEEALGTLVTRCADNPARTVAGTKAFQSL